MFAVLRERETKTETERQRETETETDRQTDRQTETKTEGARERDVGYLPVRVELFCFCRFGPAVRVGDVIKQGRQAWQTYQIRHEPVLFLSVFRW